MAKMRELDAQLAGLFITRAAISDVSADQLDDFMETHIEALIRQTQEHPVSIEDRISKAGAKYQLS
nr:hypothetical protein [uncultured Shimia sp.]